MVSRLWDAHRDALVAQSLQESVALLVAIGTSAGANAALEGFEEHLDVRLVRCRADKFLERL